MFWHSKVSIAECICYSFASQVKKCGCRCKCAVKTLRSLSQISHQMWISWWSVRDMSQGMLEELDDHFTVISLVHEWLWIKTKILDGGVERWSIACIHVSVIFQRSKSWAHVLSFASEVWGSGCCLLKSRVSNQSHARPLYSNAELHSVHFPKTSRMESECNAWSR